MNEVKYERRSGDNHFVAWVVESWYYGHHYRFFSYSPWHNCGSGTRYASEAAARSAADHFMDVEVPAMLRGKREGAC